MDYGKQRRHMMELTQSCSFSDFQRAPRKHVQRLKKSGKPEVLTLNGHAEVVIQSAKGYQQLLERADLLDSVKILRRRASQSTKTDVPADKALKMIRAK